MLQTPEAYLTATLGSNPRHPPSKLSVLRIYMYTVYRSHIMIALEVGYSMFKSTGVSNVFLPLLRFSFSKTRNISKII
jgi:hypothetical protein